MYDAIEKDGRRSLHGRNSQLRKEIDRLHRRLREANLENTELYAEWEGLRSENARLYQTLREERANAASTIEKLHRATLTLARLFNFQVARERRKDLSSEGRDQLTGLHLRRAFYDMLGATFKRVDDNQVVGLLLFCDLDDFKPINDQAGHNAGDEALRVYARFLHNLSSAINTSEDVDRLHNLMCNDAKAFLEMFSPYSAVDISLQNSKVARFGGDEFPLVIEMDGISDPTLLDTILEKLRALFSFAVPLDNEDLQQNFSTVEPQYRKVKSSVGLVKIRSNNELIQTALRNNGSLDQPLSLGDRVLYELAEADRDLYRAKTNKVAESYRKTESGIHSKDLTGMSYENWVRFNKVWRASKALYDVATLAIR